jgi:hypothetical protein
MLYGNRTHVLLISHINCRLSIVVISAVVVVHSPRVFLLRLKILIFLLVGYEQSQII